MFCHHRVSMHHAKKGGIVEEKQKEKKITSLCPSVTGLATTHKCSISLKSGVHPPGIHLYKFPLFIPIIHHPSCLLDIQAFFLWTVIH